MKWTYSERGHVIKIEELGLELEVRCVTCNLILGELTQEQYPKYRDAMDQAWALKKNHARTQPEQLTLDLPGPRLIV